nr:hypothetical protein 17 [Desulfobulbaceae bacterium]
MGLIKKLIGSKTAKSKQRIDTNENYDRTASQEAFKRGESEAQISASERFIDAGMELMKENEGKEISVHDIHTRMTNGENLVDGKAIYEHAAESKDDLKVMKQCCLAELKTMIKTGSPPAPYYFERVAIIYRRQKKYDKEIEICELYIKKVDEFHEVFGTENRWDARTGPRYKKIVHRLGRARELLEKSRAANS